MEMYFYNEAASSIIFHKLLSSSRHFYKDIVVWLQSKYVNEFDTSTDLGNRKHSWVTKCGLAGLILPWSDASKGTQISLIHLELFWWVLLTNFDHLKYFLLGISYHFFPSEKK